MDMPSIHVCNKLTVENQHLTRQVRKLRRKNSGLEQELGQLKDQVRVQTLLRDYVTTRNAESQTESQWQSKREQRPLATTSRPAGKQTKGDEDKVNKLLAMHNTLLRRYEKEVKTNAEHVEAIANLNLKIYELEQSLQKANQQVERLQQSQHAPPGKAPKARGKRSRSPYRRTPSPTDTGLLQEIRKLKRERDKLNKENLKFKSELKCLDAGFFEEIEDLKYALQQSAKLNKEYETTTRQMCTRFGVPFPFPDSRPPSATHGRRSRSRSNIR
ncbi:hypothetical protein Bbelb_032870 [Branchiostoma belcheri]|nr:hypothetical protein Bbelb_032870 [Branchiostoma belcheri]